MSTAAATHRFCRNHPDRDAVGMCRRCGALVCAECSTKIDGINHCRDCLASLQRSAAPAAVTNRGGDRPVAWLMLPALFAATALVVLLAARVVSLLL